MGILCAVDLLPSSTGALKWAVTLAKKLEQPLLILYAYRLIKAHNGEAVVLKKKIEQDARQKFSVLETECLAGKGVRYEFRTEIGFVADRVDVHTRNNAMSFVVLDRRLYKEQPETFNDLVETANVPVVIVP